jgi:hypothetical protein
MVNKNYAVILVFSCWITLIFHSNVNAYDFPPYEGLELKVIGNISENYSNNITYASDQENKIEDFRTMLNLGLDFKYTGKRRFLGFSGNLTRELFVPSSDARNPSEDARLTFTYEFSEYDRISLSNTFKHSRVPGRNRGGFSVDECREYYEDQGLPSDEIESICNEFEEQFGRFRGRFDSYSNSLGFIYNKIISEYFYVSTNYNYRENWSDEEGTSDAEHHSIRLNANYKYSEPTRFSLSYNYRRSLYEGRDDDISRQSITAGIRQYITKRIYFDGNIGTDLAISDNGDDSITGNATLTGEIDLKTTAALSYSQRTSISVNTDDTFENWQVTGRLSKEFLEDLNSSLSAFYGKGDYSSTDVTDTLLGAGVKLSYNFWRSKRGSNIRGNMGYSYSNLDSTDISREYTRSSVNSNLILAF